MLKQFVDLPEMAEVQHLLKTLQSNTIVNPCRKVDKPLLLYGAGNLGRMAKQYFDRIGITIDAVIDQNAQQHRQDPYWQDIALLSPDEVGSQYMKNALLAVCVANICYSELEQTLRGQGWADIVHFYDITEAYRDRHPLSNGWFCEEITDADCDAIYSVMEHWADSVSRAHHLQFIAWRHLREDWLFAGAEMQLNNRYLIPEVKSVLQTHEVFVDIGGHQGETSSLLLTAVDFQYDALWVFEPDQQNLAVLRQKLAAFSSENNPKIHIENQALGESKTERQFFGGAGYACQLSSIGDSWTKVIPFDELDIPVTFMKLHLEGSELSALKGAKQTLIKKRPIVATTAYHNRLGIFEMADWLMRTLNDYRFYFRLHSGCGTGAVIYAVPNERYQPQSAKEVSDES